jgi:tetratricopeptide (TPR) repeat protein
MGIKCFGARLFSVAIFTVAGSGISLSAQDIAFVGSAECSQCHEAEHVAWMRSHHGWALREATPENVLGDFSDVSVEFGGITTRFFRKGDAFFVETDGEDGALTEFKIEYTVGVEPLQQYLVETRDGRLQALDLAWDTDKRRWFHLYPDSIADARDGFHWTGSYKNWQARCATCHQTDFKKNYDQNSDGYQSTWSELTVGCEACHGAGEAHVSWAQSPDSYNPDQFTDADAKGLLVAFLDGKAGQRTEIEICAGCHSRREALDPDSPPVGAAFHDHFNLALLRPGTYHADGQINDEVYVYGSFLQSKMHANGVKCSNCHEVHSGALITEGNAVCTQCHSSQGREEFPTLKLADYDTPEHHYHGQNTEGSKCVSCHMPAKTYMVVDPRRDHSFRVPRPDLSVKIGTPNACTGCHNDQSIRWAADRVSEWFPNGRSGSPNFGEVLKAAESFDNPGTAERLVELAKDREAAGIIRATAVARLAQRLDEAIAQELLPLLGDTEPLVRAATIRALISAPSGLRARFVAGLMNDNSRLVRQEAARTTLDLPTQGLDKEQLKIVADARNDYQRSLQGRLDFPETHLQLGGLALTRRNLPAAKAAFERAVWLDAQLVNAWMTLGRIAFVEDGPQSAAIVLRSAIEKNPDTAILKQSLGNALLEQGLFDDSLEALEQAQALEPREPSIPLDIARLHLAANRPNAAINELEAARARGLLIPEILEILAIAYAQTGELSRAAEAAKALVAQYPSYRAGQGVQAILDAIR